MKEQRTKESEQYCPIHDKLYRCRDDNKFICLIHGCEWTAPARRLEDKKIETVGQIRIKYG